MNWLWSTLIGKMIATALIAMVPIIELRGAIPIAVAHGLNIWVALIVAAIGNLIPVPFVIIFIKKVFAFVRKRIPRFNTAVEKLEKRALVKGQIIQKYELFGLFILVAIPLPGTGAWTGALVAAMLNIRFRKAFPAIAGGVFVAGIIVSILTYGATALF